MQSLVLIADLFGKCVRFGTFEMFAQNFVNGWIFGAYVASQCQLLNNVSSSSSSSEFRNAPFAQLFIKNIGRVDFVTVIINLKIKVKLAVLKQE